MNIRKATIQEKHDLYEIMKLMKWRVDYWWEEDLMCVLEKDWIIIWFVRELNPSDIKENISVVWNLWIHEPYRWNKLWLKLLKYLIDNIDNDIIWLDCKPSLEKYYSKLGFKKTKDMPNWFLSEEEKTRLIAMKLDKNFENL